MSMKRKRSDIDPAEAKSKRKEIIDFAIKHSLTIEPLIGCNYYVDNILLLGTCACVPERKKCPCDEALDDIKRLGHCRCRLYYKDLEAFVKRRDKESKES